MRIWEVDDNRAIPSNLVREQDFILNVRRLHRLGRPVTVVNVILASIDSAQGGRGPLEAAQERLRGLAAESRGTYAEMASGDVFLIWEESPRATEPLLLEQTAKAAMPEASSLDVSSAFRVYHLPDDYALLRQRADEYIETSRAIMADSAKAPAQWLQSDAARGPLTGQTLDRLAEMLQDIDMRRYLRTQTIYRRTEGAWNPVFEECYISFKDLRDAHFPHLDVATTDHLFMALGQALDRRLIGDLTQHLESIKGQGVSLNLAVASVRDPLFAQFAFVVPRRDHGLIAFELHVGDLLQDFDQTQATINILHGEGFKVIIDGITPAMLGLLRLESFDADYVKINASKAHLASLQKAETRAALDAVPREKLIFYRCDTDEALAIGAELNVAFYQGWRVDAVAREP